MRMDKTFDELPRAPAIGEEQTEASRPANERSGGITLRGRNRQPYKGRWEKKQPAGKTFKRSRKQSGKR